MAVKSKKKKKWPMSFSVKVTIKHHQQNALWFEFD